MSAQQLSDRCAELGMDIPRAVLANLENGRRTTISVAELLIVAQALDVPAVQLMFPLGRTAEIEPLPGRFDHPWTAVQRFTGESEYPGDSAAVELFREHDRLVYLLRQARKANDPFSAGLQQIEVENWLQPLRRVRQAMTDRGLTPPSWPADIPDGGEQ